MRETDPSLRYTPEAVRSFKGEAARTGKRELGEIARQVATQYRADTMSPVMVTGMVRLVELALVMVAGWALFAVYVAPTTLLVAEYAIVITGGSIIMVLMIELVSAYQIAALRSPAAAAGRIAMALAASLALFAVVGFFLKMSDSFSRVWFAGWFGLALGFLLVERFAVARLIRQWARNGRMERRAVIVGGGKSAEALIRQIEQQPYNDIRICGIFDDRDDSRSPPLVAGYPKLGNIDELVDFARIARIDMLIVSLPITAESRVLSMLKKLWILPVDIRLSAHSNQLRFRPRAYSFIGSLPMLDIFDKPITDWDSVAKRAFDIVFSLLGLVAFSPIMIATAIAIKLDSRGPVFFKQKRHGFNNEEINVWKFRSMYVDQCDPTARKSVTKNDPRVTRVGRFIRKASIDELPQFFNSLAGSLSLVGPRPHAVAAQSHNLLYTEVVDGYFARHRVKPGVTGWAQINGWRGEMDTDEKIRMRTEYDLHYIENWSLWFDLKILVLTPIRLLKTENAY